MISMYDFLLEYKTSAMSIHLYLDGGWQFQGVILMLNLNMLQLKLNSNDKIISIRNSSISAIEVL